MSNSAQLQAKIEQLLAENKQLQEEKQSLTRRHHYIEQISQLIQREPDWASLALHVSQYLLEMLPAEQINIGTLTNGLIQEQSVWPASPPQNDSWHQALSDWLLRYKRPFLSSQQHELPAFAGAVVAVPILNHQDQVLGLIACYRLKSPVPFQEADVQFLSLLAANLAPTLERSYLFGQITRWVSAFESLLNFSGTLGAHLNRQSLVKHLVQYAADFLGAEAGLAGLLMHDNQVLTKGYWRQDTWQSLDMQWPVNETFSTPGWVIINHCPYMTNTYLSDPLAHPIFVSFGVQNALCLPIVSVEGSVLGFIELHNKHGGREAFTWSDAHFLESMIGSGSIALHNIHLLEELKSNQSRLKALAARNLSILENERRRIARELHDEAGQVLVGIKLGLQVLGRKIPAQHQDLQNTLENLRQEINQSTTQLKNIAHTLRPPILDELGLEVALKRYLDDFRQHSDYQIHFDTINLVGRFPPAIELASYRLVQEALANIVRHAQANKIWIMLTSDFHNLHIAIRDDGQGFDPKSKPESGLGLLGMKERIITLNGSVHVDSAPQAGTSISAIIPLPASPQVEASVLNLSSRPATIE